MPEISAADAWRNARDIAEAISKGVDDINRRSGSDQSPLMTREQFINEMQGEMLKLYYRKFIILDEDLIPQHGSGPELESSTRQRSAGWQRVKDGIKAALRRHHL